MFCEDPTGRYVAFVADRSYELRGLYIYDRKTKRKRLVNGISFLSAYNDYFHKSSPIFWTPDGKLVFPEPDYFPNGDTFITRIRFKSVNPVGLFDN